MERPDGPTSRTLQGPIKQGEFSSVFERRGKDSVEAKRTSHGPLPFKVRSRETENGTDTSTESDKGNDRIQE